MTALRRAAHVGAAAADHAWRGGPGGGRRGGRARPVFEIGPLGTVTAAEPGFGPDLQKRQGLGDVVDRPERMQRAGTGVAHFINSRRDRRLDILATPGTGIALPFTPGRNHRAPSGKLRKMRQFSSIDPANEQRLCWNLNALLQKIGDGNRGEITLSWMVKPVTDRGDRPPRIVARCCSFVPDRPLTLPRRSNLPCPSLDRDIGGGSPRTLAGSHGREEDRSTS